MITLIAAASENNILGKDNTLVWHLPNDFKRFKTLTTGHCIIMGRKTFESFPKPLPNRTHIVITRQNNYSIPHGVCVVNTLEAALEIAKKDTQPFIIGGGEIYKLALDIADKIELTRVHTIINGDTYFPEINPTDWKLISTIKHEKDEKHAYAFSYLSYVRK